MKKINVQVKIRMAFAIVFSIMLLVIIYLFIQLNTISENTRTLYEHPYQVSNASRDMKTEIYLNQNLARYMIGLENDSELLKLKAEEENRDEFIQESFKIVSRQYLGSKASTDSLLANYEAWEKSCGQLYQLKKENKTDSLKILLQHSVTAKFDQLVSSLNIISNFANNKANNTFIEVIKTEKKAILISIILIIISGILVILLILYLSKGIAYPIITFIKEANIILKKEGISKVVVDEELLLNTLDELKKAYLSIETQSREIEIKKNQLATINIELEDKIILRTAEINKAKNELEKWNAQFKKLSANAPGMIFQFTRRTDGSYCVPIASEGIRKIYGCSPDDVVNDFSPIAKYIHPDDTERMMVEIESSANKLTDFNFEYRVKRPGLAIKWMMTKSTPEKLEDGTITWYGFNTDISELVKKEEELKKIKNLLLEGQKIAHLGTFEYIAETGNTFWSAEEYSIYGLDSNGSSPDYETLLAKSIHPEDVDLLSRTFFNAMQEGLVYELEHRIIRPDGSLRWVFDRAHPYFDNDGKLIRYVGSTLDITERKNAEESLLISLQNLERSNKDLEQFVYVANHDLQEPLRMISSYTQLLEQKYKDKLDQDANDYIQFAVNGAIRLQRLLNDLLEFSKIKNQTRKNEWVDSSIILGQAVSNLQQLIRENSVLITNDELPLIHVDEMQMVRVFQNLIENAIKFRKKTDLPKIHISCTKQNDMYQFSIADNGIGIEKQYHDKIFIVFQRLHSVKDFPGTGIGLSICKRIIERHDGAIWFESKINEGTTFYFTLPV